MRVNENRSGAYQVGSASRSIVQKLTKRTMAVMMPLQVERNKTLISFCDDKTTESTKRN